MTLALSEGIPKAGRKEWIGLTVLVLPLLLVSMDMTVMYFAVPFIAADLEPTGSQQLWMVDIYAFVLAGLLITMGTLGDRIGRRLLLIVGAAAFGAASVAAAFAVSPEMLIASRAVQGIGGATLMPSTLALIRNMFLDEKQRKTAVAVWSASLSAGAALGPVISGVLLGTTGWWGAIFLINVPFILLLLVTAPFLLPEYRTLDAGKFDFLSVLLSMGTVLPIIYALKEGLTEGFAPLPIGLLVGGIALGALFLYRQSTSQDPMIDLKLFSNKGFGPSITVNLVCFFGMIGFGVFTTQYLQEVMDLDPLAAALWTMPGPIVGGFVAPVAATMLVHVIRPAYLISIGFLVAAGGFGISTQIAVDSTVWMVVAGSGLIAVGTSTVLTLITDMVVGAAPPEKAGAASSLLQTGQEFGGALGIALLGTVGAAVYGNAIAERLPEGVSGEALHAASETIGGAEAAAKMVPDELAQPLMDAARVSFTQGMNTAALVGAVVAVLTALMAVVFLRHVESLPKEEEDDQPQPDDSPTVTFPALRAMAPGEQAGYGPAMYGYGPTAQYAYTPRAQTRPMWYPNHGPGGQRHQYHYPPANDQINYPPSSGRR